MLAAFLPEAAGIGNSQRREAVLNEMAQNPVLLFSPEIVAMLQEVVATNRDLIANSRARMLVLLEDPQRNAIRKLLGMELLPEDLEESRVMVEIVLTPNDTEVIRRRITQRHARMLTNMALEISSLNMAEEAAEMLAEARRETLTLTQNEDQDGLFLRIAGLQIQIGEPDEAKETLRQAQHVLSERPEMLPSERDATLAAIVAIKLRARALPEAEALIRTMQTGLRRDDMVTRLFREQLRIQLQEGPNMDLLELFSTDATKQRAMELVAAADLQLPIDDASDETLQNTAVRFILDEHPDSALAWANAITDERARNELLARICETRAVIGRPYTMSDEFQRSVRQDIFERIGAIALSITTPPERAAALISALSVLQQDDFQTPDDAITTAFLQASDAIENVPDADWQAGMLMRLIAAASPLVGDLMPKLPAAVRQIESEPQRAIRLAQAAELLRQHDLPAEAREALDESFDLLTTITDLRARVETRTTLATIAARLGDNELSGQLFQRSIDEVNDQLRMPAIVSDAPDRIDVLRQADLVLADIVRAQIESGMVPEALRTIRMITEPFTRDIIYRKIAYRFIFQARFDEAEEIANQITNRNHQSIRNAILLDLEAARRGIDL